MKTALLRLRLCAAACLLGGALPALADAPPELVSGNVQFMSNYIGRGLAQSVGNPSVEAELDVNSQDGPYGGLEGTSTNWVNKVYPGDDVALEVDMWGGWRQHFGPDWVMKAGVLRLQFPGDYVPQKQPTDEPNTTELYAFIAWRAYSLRWDWSYTNAFATPDSKGSWYWTPPVPRPCRRASRRSSTSAASTRPAAVP
ncbi:MAG TPA: TorF family putative porin [Gammaproteobacteria bacterium]